MYNAYLVGWDDEIDEKKFEGCVVVASNPEHAVDLVHQYWGMERRYFFPVELIDLTEPGVQAEAEAQLCYETL